MKSRCSNEESNQSCWILVDLTNSAVIRLYHLSVSPTTPTIKFRTDSQEGEFNTKNHDLPEHFIHAGGKKSERGEVVKIEHRRTHHICGGHTSIV